MAWAAKSWGVSDYRVPPQLRACVNPATLLEVAEVGSVYAVKDEVHHNVVTLDIRLRVRVDESIYPGVKREGKSKQVVSGMGRGDIFDGA